MLTAKRVILTTICGFGFGLVCMYLAGSNPNSAEPMTDMTKTMIIISRTMMGFMLGISALRLSWWLHGLLIGFIASIPMAIPIIDNMGIVIGTLVMGIIYGILTELITTVVLKSPPAGIIMSQKK